MNTKAAVTTVSQSAVLPEALANVENLPKEERERIVTEYAARQKERFEKRLQERVQRFDEKLKDKASKERVIIVKRIQLQMLKHEIKDRKVAMKALRAELHAIKDANRKAKKGKDVTAQAKATQAPAKS